ncbi:MAG: glycosyltransferase [Deltaproteobacteria bacterium]|nr:glycosyltransferase [Deltaproteobacteria bacterium]
MRIAQVITLFLPDFVGGATLACAATARALRARGHAVEVFCGRPHGDAPPYAESRWDVDGIAVTGVNAAAGYDALGERAYHHPEVAPVFARFLARARPDVVHFHSIQALGADLVTTARAHGVPVVVTMHDWWWWCPRLFLVDDTGYVCPERVASERCGCAPGFDFVGRRAHLERCLAAADRILTPSRFLADAAIANGVPAARVRVVPNGVAPGGPRPARRPGPVRFGWFGGPDHRMKGLPTLLAAVDRTACGGFEVVLHTSGTVRRRGLGRTLVDRVGHALPVPLTIDDRIVVAPAFAPAELPAALAALDCLVVPSLMRESFSLVTREALAAGVPVIASDCGGPLEIVRPERNGLVFATGDPDDLATCLRRFVLEPGLAEALAAGAGATTVLALDAQIDALERVYAEVRPGRAGADAPAATPARAAVTGPSPLAPVLFLAGCDGAPYRYRVTHLRDALAARGIASRALWWSDPDAPAAIAAAGVVVVYRVPMSPWLEACLGWARACGKPLVYSCDDLLFDAAATPHDALALLPADQRAWWLGATARYAVALGACDVFLGATEPLAEAAARLGVPGFVARNGLGLGALAIVERLARGRAAAPARAATGEVVLAYQSGTTMHELDFALVAPALARVLGARPHARLRLGGHLGGHPALIPFAGRIDCLPLLPWPESLAALAAADVQLAPLRTDAFSDAKSEVKYLEAGALGLPTVASPTSAYRRAIRHGENGFLASTPADWEQRLLALVDDPALGRRLGNRARDDVFLHATPAALADALVDALVDALARARELAARRPPTAGATAPTPAAFAEVGRCDLAPDDLEPGTAVETSDTPSGFVTGGRTFGQAFRASAEGLCRVDVRVGTDGRRHPHRLHVRLAESPHARTPLRAAVVDAAALADGAWVAATFAPIENSAGRELYFWVESDGGAATGPTLWTSVAGPGDAPPGGLHLDHAPARGSLTFRTYHRPATAS